MKSPLFWKIFLSFWLTTVLINFSAWFVYTIFLASGPSWERQHSQKEAVLILPGAAQSLASGGEAGYARMVAGLPEEHRASLALVDPAVVPDARDTRDTLVVSPGGTRYRIVYALSGEAHHSYGLGDMLYRSINYFIVSLLAGMLFAVALAWYLTTPIRRIRAGFGMLASGELDTRLAPAMGRRRDEMADLACDFDHMAERLQRLIGLRDQLLHDVSHELRSPLARMHLAIALQRKGQETTTVAMERVEQEIRRLDELVGELLSLARAESNAEAEERYVDLVGLVDAVAANAGFEAQTRHIQVRRTSDVVDSILRGSPELMRRALENVLRNAIHVSRDGGEVTIALCRADSADGARVRIVIEDDGPGVHTSQLGTIFEAFVRVGSTGQSGAGFGLGLSIARRAVAALGGTIEAANRAPHGLSVTLTMPLAVLAEDVE